MINQIKLYLHPLPLALKYTWHMILATLLGAFIEVVLINYQLYVRQPRDYIVAIQKEQNLYLLALVIIDVALITPLIEEAAFRLPLNPTKKNLSLGLSSLIAVCLLVVTGWGKLLADSMRFSGLITFLLFASISYLVFRHNFKNPMLLNTISSLFKRKSMIYITSILFGLFHYKVIGSPKYTWLYVPLLFPYYLSGLILAKARIKAGFACGVMTHALFNLLLVLLNLSMR
ncbi:CPBP family glutamic-type intramembrane protease [Fulvivirga kasyanovii]|uniref:CPBP family intramembrane metalloprotease n=1 Tax=Fulvivirga kasyanovii TaxID=396812 RepID=A0ABW9RJD2_9BACT|nr:CPBP family glutamic-type intramembrane protease [Fulvivirga kasyanovii]MTI24081.1 CPBP family intramembrane metalloprotease [Fulvivirga kasyanovii]